MRRQLLLGVIAASLLALGAAAFVRASSSGPAVSPSPCGPITKPVAQLRVVGAQMSDSTGRRFIPYGLSVVGGPQTTTWNRNEKAALAQIVAAHDYWHANTIRLQVSENLVFDKPPPGRTFNVRFVRSLDRLVCAILRRHDVPVINDTTLFTGHSRGPRARTLRFWRFIAQRYGNRFPVIFDLYNEPQVTRDPRTGRFMAPAHAWRVWRDGGRSGRFHYVGMQQLVDAIRGQGAHNVIWAEEPYYMKADMARFGLLPDYLLRGKNIAYTFHKPNMEPSSRSFTDVREVAAKGIPIIDSEWGQFAATDRPWMCQPNAYTTIPAYLEFLRTSSIGMLSWSLQPGALVKGVPRVDTVNDGNYWAYTTNPRDLSHPSEMQPSYGCTSAARGQGAGRIVLDYFASNSQRPPEALFPTFRSR